MTVADGRASRIKRSVEEMPLPRSLGRGVLCCPAYNGSKSAGPWDCGPAVWWMEDQPGLIGSIWASENYSSVAVFMTQQWLSDFSPETRISKLSACFFIFSSPLYLSFALLPLVTFMLFENPPYVLLQWNFPVCCLGLYWSPSPKLQVQSRPSFPPRGWETRWKKTGHTSPYETWAGSCPA